MLGPFLFNSANSAATMAASRTPQIIQHLHLSALTPYAHATLLQALSSRAFLNYKKAQSADPNAGPPPPATILTFTPPPVYTTGRREDLADYPADLVKTLREPIEPNGARADFVPATRGGLVTFHGPGQLVIYPSLSLQRPASFDFRRNGAMSAKCYVDLLEQSTINTLARYGVSAFRTKDPGVWVDSMAAPRRGERGEGREKKIAALGIHVRRYVPTYGVGLNVSTDLRWFDRIVACGIEGKGVTSLAAELGRDRWAEEYAEEKSAGRATDEGLPLGAVMEGSQNSEPTLEGIPTVESSIRERTDEKAVGTRSDRPNLGPREQSPKSWARKYGMDIESRFPDTKPSRNPAGIEDTMLGSRSLALEDVAADWVRDFANLVGRDVEIKNITEKELVESVKRWGVDPTEVEEELAIEMREKEGEIGL